MAMVCSKCGTSHEQRLQCPSCGGRLQFQAVGRSTSKLALPRTRWQETSWGRVLIGLLLSQGLFHGFRQLSTGILLAINSDGGVDQTITNPVGFICLQILQMIAVLAGGIMAGSGQRYGVILGAVVGVWNGVICACLQFGSPQTMSSIVLYGQPIVHVAFGSLGGWLGFAIWRPVRNALEACRPKGMGKSQPRPSSWLAGRVTWSRVLVGVAIAVGGSSSANFLRDVLLDATTGRLQTTDFQDYVISWELKALAVLAGSFLAGATTRNGVKHGLCVGLASSVVLIGLEARGAGRTLEIAALIVLSTIALSLAGGWFGAQMFPPVSKYHRRPGAAGAAAMS